MNKRNLVLIVVLVGIVASITYLNSLKVPAPQAPAGKEGPATVGSYYRDFVSPSGFINADPFELKDVIGKKVILFDFWTYSCINCQRTLPYMNAWWDAYKDKGLLIVGVHTPEFDFEKELSNVQAAVEKYGVEFPVVLDNDKGTWSSYGNRYWPRKYLIDLDGQIVYDHIGEGNYDETEAKIQSLLGLSADMSKPLDTVSVDFNQVESPEVYFGAERNEFLGNGVVGQTGPQSFTFPAKEDRDTLYLDGTWNIQASHSEGSGKIHFNYSAKNVYMVASAQKPTTLEVWLDGKFVKTITVQADDLYPLIEGSDYGKHQLELRIPSGDLKVFTLTFG